jgi:hypothetical protein
MKREIRAQPSQWSVVLPLSESESIVLWFVHALGLPSARVLVLQFARQLGRTWALALCELAPVLARFAGPGPEPWRPRAPLAFAHVPP